MERMKPFVPCRCNRCFFCKNELTGLYGPPKELARKKAQRTSTSSTPGSRSSSRAGTPTIAFERGSPVELIQDHVRYPTEPVLLCKYSKDCGVCMKEGRVRKPTGVNRNGENDHLYRLVP